MRLVSQGLVAALSLSIAILLPSSGDTQSSSSLVYVDEGAEWPHVRSDFYTLDQGAQMIPLAWLKALKQANRQPFLADSLARYGYLPNPDKSTNPSGLPVGFTSVESPQGPIAGMTCAACHTRQITVSGTAYRIDGGPALADFEPFLADLDKAVLAVLADDASFKTFATAVLGTNPPEDEAAILHADVTVWSARFHILMSRSLPTKRLWGAARLDAVSMIFNRVAGLDLGSASTYLIPNNIRVADAPTRYPFLWNAWRQDYTQWPGFADNGNDFFALSRNLGEVYGVFATFHPLQQQVGLLNRNYLAVNSANFDGLDKLETVIKKMTPPKWPWKKDTLLALRGLAVYERPNADDGTGGCASCHGIRPGQPRFPELYTWRTPRIDVGTDRREWAVMQRDAESGSLEGASVPGIVTDMPGTAPAMTILGASVAGSIIQYEVSKLFGKPDRQMRLGMTSSPLLTTSGSSDAATSAMLGATPETLSTAAEAPLKITPLEQFKGTFRVPGGQTDTQTETMQAETSSAASAVCKIYCYEARVLKGIWAAAPYLHNGSVPTLADLLKRPADRPKSFAIGPAYDTDNVGLAAEQPKGSFVLHTTGCDDLESGDSNCGHDYGTRLSDSDKKALLEFLKAF